MQKKSFVFISIAIALTLFAILPVINYLADPSRVLHHDYVMRYKKFHQHELVLKTMYVIEHKHDYDTLVFGSSRGGFLDMRKISDHAFNMSHGFGTVQTYLETLRTLLNSGVTVKNVWIGINDYDIWKDHTDELYRLIYYNNIFKDIRLYSHWLFRFIPESVKILTKNKPLFETNEVTDQDTRLDWSREKEETVKQMNHRHLAAAKLGYTGKFRIDKSIEEVREIKALCQSHDINLTVFFYPTYYKTYLFYNQKKIEEFKRKLANVVDFYDFYDIGPISFDQHKWFEGSHFVPSVGDYIIDSIHHHQHLVTKENVEERIKEVHEHLKHMPILDDEGIYLLNKDTVLDTDRLTTVFDLADAHFAYSKNDQFTLKRKDDIIIASVELEDPYFLLDNIHTDAKQVVLLADITSPVESLFQIYYRQESKKGFSEKSSFKLPLHKGKNRFRIILLGTYLNNGIRIDFTRNRGDYVIEKLIIKNIK